MVDLYLGVDIAARKGRDNCGLALIDASKIVELAQPSNDLIWVRAIDGTDLRAVAAVVSEAATLGARLILERQFVMRAGGDPGTTEKLIGTRVRFETVAQIRGVPFDLCYPSVWQTILALLGDKMPLKAAKSRKPKGKAQTELPVKAPRMIKDTKAAARILCARLYPGVELTGDQCDALLMVRHQAWQRGTGA